MNKDEATKHFNIPQNVIDEYEKLNTTFVEEHLDYTDKDVENLGTMMTLYDVGFSNEEVAHIMEIMIAEDKSKMNCKKMLDEKRCQCLDEIHNKENQINSIDYLINKIKRNK